MSLTCKVRCIPCMLFYKDHTRDTDIHFLRKHIWRHDYKDKLKAARLLELISECERPSKRYLNETLTELSII